MDTSTNTLPQRLESFSNSTRSDEAFIVRSVTEQKDVEPEIVEKEESPPHVESANPLPDFISFFRAKLKDPKQHLLCFSCFSLWTAAHIALLVILLLNITYIVDIVGFFSSGSIAWGVLLLLLVMVQLALSAMAMRALNCCDTRSLRGQYVMLCIVWIPILNLGAAVVVQDLTAVVFTECILGIVLQLYCVLVFRRVYLWAKYFEKGGKYRVDMMRPKDSAVSAKGDEKK